MGSRIESLAERSVAMCRTIAGFTETPGSTTRTFLCDAMRDCHATLRGWMESLGMRVWVDAAGNLRGLYAGRERESPRLAIGSHLDTVPNAGAFDGVLGVVLGIALVEALDGERLPIEIEVIGFSEEEGVRFGFPFIGSRAFVGTLEDSLLVREDPRGTSVASAIASFGLDPSALADAVFDPRTFAYLEFHIEQGPVLANTGQPIAVVDAIAGQSRATVVFEGEANHAGTTPMSFRRDALTAAAEWILEVERRPGAVSTVGKLDIPGAATNVIPGNVVASLDVRHTSDDARRVILAAHLEAGERIAARRGVRFSHSMQLDQGAVPMDSRLMELIDAPRMTSGAGHDAMIIAPFLPSAMIFLRSPNGISHHPEETVLVEDVAAALRAGLQFLRVVGSTLPYE